MTLLQVIVLAIVQGLTEFLPISSSAHLILPSAVLDWPDQGLAFDVAVHVGTLIAVLAYFRRDLTLMVQACGDRVLRNHRTNDSRLVGLIIIATIPAGLAGLVFDSLIETYLRSVLVIALATIVFGVILGIADRTSTRSLSLDSINWRHALVIGLAQALALIPGTSRSGITMTAALALGFDRLSAAKFSFLMSIPVIALSGAYKGAQLLAVESVPWAMIGLAVALSAAVAYACIHTFLVWVNRIGMMPFVWYRLALGAVLLFLVWGGLA